MKTGLKTATEVISENSKTYKTIRTFQAQIIPAVKKLCVNIIELGKLYDMEFEGKKISSFGDYEISVVMGDAVLEDSGTKLDRAILLLNNGLMSKKTILTDPKYGIGMTEEQADEELARIAAEGKLSATAFDVFGSQTLE
jgi:A118 family predicted phage portal protein